MSDAETIRFVPWPDPELERCGFPVRSAYVEFCYAGVIGPTSMLLLRLVAAMLEGAGPKGLHVELDELTRSLGIGTGTGVNSVLRKTLARLDRFDMVTPTQNGYAVRLFVLPLSPRRLRVAPVTVQRIHERLMARRNAEIAGRAG